MISLSQILALGFVVLCAAIVVIVSDARAQRKKRREGP